MGSGDRVDGGREEASPAAHSTLISHRLMKEGDPTEIERSHVVRAPRWGWAAPTAFWGLGWGRVEPTAFCVARG